MKPLHIYSNPHTKPTSSVLNSGSVVDKATEPPRLELLCFIGTEPFNLNTPEEVKLARAEAAKAGFYLINVKTWLRREGEHGFTPTGLSLQVA